MLYETNNYNQGWNARMNGVSLDMSATTDWKDGWWDADYHLFCGFSVEYM